MPVTKERPHIIDLLNLAAEQRRKLDESKSEVLARPVSIWYSDNEAWERNPLFRLFLGYSRFCERISANTLMKVVRSASWMVLLIVLIYSTPLLGLPYDRRPTPEEVFQWSDEQRNFYIVSVVVNVWFLINSILLMSGLLIRTKVEKAFNREMTRTEVALDIGIVGFTLDLLCLSYGISDVGLWFQVTRLFVATQFVLDLFPHIGILMSSLGNGLKSIVYTMMLLFLLLMSFAVVGHKLFYQNDPYHFGHFGLAAVTFFQITTFDSWSEVYNLAANGCDAYPSEYTGNVNLTLTSAVPIFTDYGQFYQPVCYKPTPQPVQAAIVFCLYELLAGYMIVNMCTAVVSIGINERLEELRNLELFGGGDEEEDEEPISFQDQGEAGSRPNIDYSQENKNDAKKRKQMFDGKAAKMLGGNVTGRKIKENLTKVWESMRKAVKHKFFSDASGAGGGRGNGRKRAISFSELDLEMVLKETRFLIKGQRYLMAYACLILAAASLQLYNEIVGDSDVTNSIHLFFQCCFVVDSALRLFSNMEKPRNFVTDDPWTPFDLLVTILLFVPTLARGAGHVQFLEFLRVFRVARVLQIASPLAMDLHIILSAVYNSAVCLLYVCAIVFLFFGYYALLGVLLFKQANPVFFGSFGTALRNLLQVMTLDGWSEMMRYSAYGCNAFPYPQHQWVEVCATVSGSGVGWLSHIYFVSFVILAGFVLTSLLTGVIITSMELLREGILEEAEIWEKTYKVQRRYKVEKMQIDLLLELFEDADDKRTGIVTYETVETMVGTMGFVEGDLFVYYVKVDKDKNGQLDFSEFCEFLLLLGPMYNDRKEEEERLKREEKKKKLEDKHKFHIPEDVKIDKHKFHIPEDVKSRLSHIVHNSTESISHISGAIGTSILELGHSISRSSHKMNSPSQSAKKQPAANSEGLSFRSFSLSSSTKAKMANKNKGSANETATVSAPAATASTTSTTGSSAASHATLTLEDVEDSPLVSPPEEPSVSLSPSLHQVSAASPVSAPASAGAERSVESKEDPTRAHSTHAPPPLARGGGFLSRIARIYAVAEDDDEGYYTHGA